MTRPHDDAHVRGRPNNRLHLWLGLDLAVARGVLAAAEDEVLWDIDEHATLFIEPNARRSAAS